MTPIGMNTGTSLRQRLLSLTLLTSGIGLLAGCGAFLVFDSYNAKNKTVGELRLTADLIGSNAAAALAFDDALNGAKLLQALRTLPHIRGAVLYHTEDHFFASYLRADLNGRYLFPIQLPGEIEWTAEKLTVVRPIILDDRILGKILVESDLQELHGRTVLYAKVTAAIAAGALLTVYFLTVLLGRGVTGPMQRLAQIARNVAEKSDYSLRAPALSGRELGQLSVDFNHMLDEIS